MHHPVLTLSFEYVHAAGGEVDSDTAVEVLIVEEVSLDDLALIAQRDKELFKTEVSIVLHDVPEDRMAPDLDHRLWLYFSFFSQAGP